MPTPLVMLGSGDYATRLEVKGTRLLKQRGAAPASTDTNPDADARGHHGYQFTRGKFSSPQKKPAPSRRTTAGGDSFELCAPLHAALAWLQLQSLTLSDLAESAQQDAQTLKPAEVIRGTTPNSPTTHPTPTPTPQPAFVRALRAAKARLRAAAPPPRVAITPVASNFKTLQPAQAPGAPTPAGPTTPAPQPASTRREPHEPHPQAAQDPQPHPRDPADPRLFADDARTRRRARRLQGHRLRARRSPDQKRRPQTASQQGPLFGSLA